MSFPVFGLSAFDQTDGTTYAQAVTRSTTDLGIKAGFVYFSPTTAPHWSDRCDDHPSDHDLVISIKRYIDDTQWIQDHQTFANEIPLRTGLVYIVNNEEPEPDMSGAEFIRRWDLVKSIWENKVGVVMSVCLQEWTLNSLSGRPDWHEWVPTYIEHVGWSIYTYTPDIENNVATSAAQLVGRVTTAMQADGRPWSAFGWGCGVINSQQPIGHAFRITRAQWLYDSAQLCHQNGAKHVMWFDFDWTPQGSIDLRIRPAVEGGNLQVKWDEAFDDFSLQNNPPGGTVGAEIVSVDTNTTGTGAAVAQLSVLIPNNGNKIAVPIEAGMEAVVFWSEVAGGLTTNYAIPSGWSSIIALAAINSSVQAWVMCRKTLALADVGSTFNFGTLTANRRQNIVLVILRNAVFDSAGATNISGLVSDTNVVMPGIDPTAIDCLLLNFSTIQHAANNTALVSGTPASGWTEEADFGTSAVASVSHGSIVVQSKQESGGGPFSATSFVASHTGYDASITIAFAASAIVVPINMIVETDIAQALGVVLGINRIIETDIAQPVTQLITHTIGRVTETDIAFPITFTGGGGGGGGAPPQALFVRSPLSIAAGIGIGIR